MHLFGNVGRGKIDDYSFRRVVEVDAEMGIVEDGFGPFFQKCREKDDVDKAGTRDFSGLDDVLFI
jgi:hypothetical protein